MIIASAGDLLILKILTRIQYSTYSMRIEDVPLFRYYSLKSLWGFVLSRLLSSDISLVFGASLNVTSHTSNKICICYNMKV